MAELDVLLNLSREGNEQAFEKLCSLAEKNFISLVKKNYGNDIDEEFVKELLRKKLLYYVKNVRKTKLSGCLYKYAKTCLNDNPNYNTLITKNPNKIREHYIEKLYNDIISKLGNLKVLYAYQVRQISERLIDNYIKNYKDGEKSSSVGAYFSIMIRRKVLSINNEEDLIKLYISYFSVPGNVRRKYTKKNNYIYLQYKNYISYVEFYNISNEVLSKIVDISNFTEKLKIAVQKYVKNKVQEQLKNYKNNKEYNKEIIIKYYEYIINDVADKFKDKVTVPKSELINYTKRKYYDYANAYFEGNSNMPFSSYVNTRLSDRIKNKKRFYYVKKTFTKEEKELIEKEKELANKLIYKYVDDMVSFEELKEAVDKKIEEKTNDYYKKERTRSLHTYLNNIIHHECILVRNKYIDSKEKDLETPIK